jgi:hypothetical protein
MLYSPFQKTVQRVEKLFRALFSRVAGKNSLRKLQLRLILAPLFLRLFDPTL